MNTRKTISTAVVFMLVFAFLTGNLSASFAESNADEMYAEGMKYFTGDGVEQNTEKGSELLLAAADAGSVDAMMSLGYFCAYGTGKLFMEDYEEGVDPVYALEWFNKAA